MRIGIGVGITGPGASVASVVVGGPSLVSGYSLITITESELWTAPATGNYRVRCYGWCMPGGDGQSSFVGSGGGGGGFAEKVLALVGGTDYYIGTPSGNAENVVFADETNSIAYVSTQNADNSDPGAGNFGDTLYTGGSGGINGYGGTRATEAGNGVDGGGAAPGAAGQPGQSGVGIGSGGGGGGEGDPPQPGGAGDPGYVTILRVS